MRTHRLPHLLIAAALWWLLATPCLAQTSVEAFRKAFREQAAFTDNDFSSLAQDQIVAKLLPPTNNREVAVCGLVKLPVPPQIFLQFTRDNVAQLNNRAILQIGRFSNTPTLEDLQPLTIDNRDIEDMKRCTVGSCSLKMSAAMIDRLHKDVDWTAADYRAQATTLYRQMLLDYVRDYLARGEPALMEYNDRSHGLRVDEEQRSLLDASIYFNQFAPEFAKYVRSFPKTELPGVENYLFWSKIKFGLKPVVTITHVLIYPRPGNSAPQVLVASKQIYAAHYFDSSLAMSAFIRVPAAGGTAESYLLYTNRSRADALGGLFSGLKRSIVEGEAMGSLQSILQEQKLKMEAGNKHPGETGQPGNEGTEPAPRHWRQWRVGGLHPFWWLFVIVSLSAAVFWLVKRNSGERDAGS